MLGSKYVMPKICAVKMELEFWYHETHWCGVDTASIEGLSRKRQLSDSWLLRLFGMQRGGFSLKARLPGEQQGSGPLVPCAMISVRTQVQRSSSSLLPLPHGGVEKMTAVM